MDLIVASTVGGNVVLGAESLDTAGLLVDAMRLFGVELFLVRDGMDSGHGEDGMGKGKDPVECGLYSALS